MPPELVLPPGVEYARDASAADQRVGGQATIVNETDLPDEQVQQAVATYIEEHASMLGIAAGNTTFQSYANQGGSLLARRKFRTPGNVIDEIILARDLAERDDDVGSTIGMMIATAFGEGMLNVHKDEVTVALFDEIAKHANLDAVWGELYRELLISAQVNTVALFTRESFQFTPEGADRQRTRSIVAPLIGVLPAEQIRVVGNDLFGTGVLAYKPATASQDLWLREFFSGSTSPARKLEMRREDPVLTTLLVEQLPVTDEDTARQFSPEQLDPNLGDTIYRLNPRMVARSTFPKGAWRYPRPLLTRNFALLEAKRLLNIMDYALLQGGSNFLVVAKKGSDQRPAMPQEVENLREVVKRASQTGVIVGDHRLNIDIITPDLKELLSESKRRLIGRKLAQALLRLPEHATDNSAAEGMKAEIEILTRVITADRRLLKRHVERHQYEEAVKRNSSSFETGAASIWFPKIILQGANFFTDYILKMRDRGDISRHSAVAAGGFDYDAEVQTRKREKQDDRVMTPAAVPFSSPNAGGPQDNQPGRPRGASPNNGAPGAQTREPPARVRPRQVIQRNAGETVTAMYDDDVGSYRVGERTYEILEEYADTKEIGRVTPAERSALERIESGDMAPHREGPLTIVPVNGDYEIAAIRAVRLATGASMLVGERIGDDALVARAFCFREPEFTPLDAQETAMRWGFPSEAVDRPERPEAEPESEEEHASQNGHPAQVIHLHIDTRGGKVKRTLVYDEDGKVTGSEDEPVEDPDPEAG